MAHAFKVIPAKPTFGSVKPIYEDYLLKKKRDLLIEGGDYKTYYLRKRERCPGILLNEFNRYNLVYNLYSKEDLNYVQSVGLTTDKNVPVYRINTNLKPFYQYYSVDPKGQLFGKTPCGELNYVNYMVPDANLEV